MVATRESLEILLDVPTLRTVVRAIHFSVGVSYVMALGWYDRAEFVVCIIWNIVSNKNTRLTVSHLNFVCYSILSFPSTHAIPVKALCSSEKSLLLAPLSSL